MQKAEAQHTQTHNQPAQRQGRGASLESPQGEQLAQLEAMAEASPHAGKLAQLAATANDSPQAAAQRKVINAIQASPRMAAQRAAFSATHNSPPVTAQRQQLDGLAGEAAQREEAEEPLQAQVAQREAKPAKPNDTGLPDNLKSGIENLSGMSMDNVKVHYNSSQPAQLNAHAYAQGTDIHVAPGQERHLPHEAWHVVQQAQGRVRPTMQMKEGVQVNDDAGLEHEADVMGWNALQLKHADAQSTPLVQAVALIPVVQKVDWSWWGGGARRVLGETAGLIGGLGGAISGTVTGGVKGYQKGDGIFSGAKKGLLEGGKEGYERPGATLGAITGGLIGNAVGTLGAIGGAVAGATEGYVRTKDMKKSIGAGLAGGLVGYMAPTIGGASVGALIGDKVNEKINPKPLKTEIEHTAGHITLDGFAGRGVRTNHEVGKKMEAKLAATDPVQGSATGVNWTWMQYLRNKYRQANIVRGHLLNHDLGGFGMPENLYPISTKANAEHSSKVEQEVKKLLGKEIDKSNKGEEIKLVHYTVVVNENVQGSPENAAFNCTFNTEGESERRVSIPSDLGKDAGGFGGGKKDNPLHDTDWHHGGRKGFEKGKERDSLASYKQENKINIKSRTQHGLTANEDAKYGNSGNDEVLKLILGSLSYDYFNRWGKDLKFSILEEMGAKGDFTKETLKFVKSTTSYIDNIGDADAIAELIGQIMEEQLLELEKKHGKQHVITVALNDAQKIMKNGLR